MKKVQVNYHLEMTQPLSEEIKGLVEKYVQTKVDAYFNKILKNKPDATIMIDVKIAKTKAQKFDGAVHFSLDNDDFHYTTSTPFKDPKDVVGHAFDRVKEYLSKK